MCIFLPVSKTLTVQHAEAQWAVIDAANLQINFTNSLALQSLVEKEYAFDGIVYVLINAILERIIESLTEWVQNGFRDSPGFVTDLDGFLLDTANKAAGEFLLLDGPLEFLCSPFKLDIRLALQANYLNSGAYYKPECSLTDAINNVEAFIAGDFSQGGWDGWAAMTLNPKNNLYGSIFEAQSEFEIAIQGAKREEFFQLDFGDGFFGVEECDDDGKNCQRVTPGSIVQDGLSNTLNLGNERLTIADEIDEFIGALFAQLLSTVFNSVGGLAGFSASSQNVQYDLDIQGLIDTSSEAAGTMLDSSRDAIDGASEVVDEALDEEDEGGIPTWPDDEPPLTVVYSECFSWEGYKYVDDEYGERCIWVGFDTSGDGCPPGSVFDSNGMCVPETFGPGCPVGTTEEIIGDLLVCVPE